MATTQTVGGEVARRLAQLWQPLVALTSSDADIQQTRAAYEALHAEFAPPEGIGVSPANAGGVPSLLLGRDPDEPPSILYLHGGGYILGSAFGYRPLAGALAVAASPLSAPSVGLDPRVIDEIDAKLRAIAAGEIRDDISPEDVLRALVGMCYMHDQPGWQASVLRLVDVFVDGLRIRPIRSHSKTKRKKSS